MPEAPKLEAPQGWPLHHVQFRAISEGLSGNGILSNTDFEVTAGTNALEIDIASGTMYYQGTEYDYAGESPAVTLTQGDGTYDRWDTIAFDTATPDVVKHKGAPSSTPEPPDISGGEVLLAIVYVPAGATDIDNSNILNWRSRAIAQASRIQYDDSPGVYNVTDVDAALDELQEAAQLKGYPLGSGDLDSGAVTTSEIADATIVDADIASGTTIDRGKLDDEKVSVTGITADQTTAGEEAYFVDTSGGTVTLTLASADAAEGNFVTVIDIGGTAGTDAITINTEGNETIDSGSSTTINTDYGAAVLSSNGNNWFSAGGGTGSGSGTGSGVTQDTIVPSDSGTVAAGESGVLHVLNLQDGETLKVNQAHLTLADGQPAPTDLDLVIAELDNSGGAAKAKEVVTGDGATVHDDVTGSPVASFTYDPGDGSDQTHALLVDNGNFNAGTGGAQDVATGVVAEVTS